LARLLTGATSGVWACAPSMVRHTTTAAMNQQLMKADLGITRSFA
jgi:hypothetical protein